MEKKALTELTNEAKSLADAAQAEGRDFTPEEQDKITDLLAKASELKEKIAVAEKQAEMKKAVDELAASVEITEPAEEPRKSGGSIGEKFVASAEYKNWMTQFPSGRVPEGAKGLMSPPVGFKTLLTSGDPEDSAGYLVQSDRRGLIVPADRRPLVLRDVITIGSTTSDTVEYVRELSGTNNAATVAEASATSGSSGTKPESAMAFEKDSTTVKTIAHWIPATKRALSDVAQLRTLIDSFLRDGLMQELEDQIVDGDGSGENFEGFANNGDLLTQAYSSSLLETARKARTKVRVEGRATANAYLMHPDDAQAFDLLMDNEDRYYFGGPIGGAGNITLWRLPVVESEAVAPGTAYVGDWSALVLFDREQASIQVSDSHSDFFVRNMVAVLAEMRAAFAVVRPTAICAIDLTA